MVQQDPPKPEPQPTGQDTATDESATSSEDAEVKDSNRDKGKETAETIPARTDDDASSAAEPRLGLIGRFRRLVYRLFVEPLVRSNHPPWFDARGVFFGLLVGFGTPLGGHILTITLLRMVVRFNFLIAIAFTWVCDPFNWVLIYYMFYCIGSFFLGRPRTMTFEVFRDLMQRIFSKTYFWEGLADFMALSQDLLIRWFVGSITIALTTSILGYIITYRIQKARCKRRAKKMGIQYDKLLKELEANAAQEKG